MINNASEGSGQEQGLPPSLTEMEKQALKQMGWKEENPLPEEVKKKMYAMETNASSAPIPLVIMGNIEDLGDPNEVIKDDDDETDSGPGGEGKVLLKDDLTRREEKGNQTTEKKDDESTAGAFPKQEFCPRCSHPLHLPYEIKVTEEDRRNYQIHLLGHKRFLKRVSLFNGNLVVVFRSLTSEESDMAYRQLMADAKADAFNDELKSTDAYWRTLLTYRLSMGIQSIWTEKLGTVEIEEIENFRVDQKASSSPHTKLRAYLPYVTKKAFPNESLRRVIGAAFHRFQLLIEKLEAEALSPDF